MKSELQGVLASELAARKISYTRSDGSPWTLSVKDVVDRAPDFEMAYNPNDCVELRWAAPEAAKRPRHASVTRRRRSARRCRTTAPGSASGTGRRIVRTGVCAMDAPLLGRVLNVASWRVGSFRCGAAFGCCRSIADATGLLLA